MINKYNNKINLIEWLILVGLETLVTSIGLALVFAIDAMSYAYASGLIVVDLLIVWLFLDSKRN
ncbi:MAG: hypothetical protein WC307_07145 [Candidatus Nanoarchaeia archaeon]|jgi:hypothetical protein